MYQEVENGFLKHHRSTLNVLLHLLTTPLGISLGLALVAKVVAPGLHVALGLAIVYVASLPLARVPLKLVALTAVLMCAVGRAADILAIHSFVKPMHLICGLLIATLLQEVAHMITGESTYESSYSKQSGAVLQLVKHTYLLMPLILSAIANMRGSFLSLFFVRPNYVRLTKLESKEEKALLDSISQWVMSQKPSEQTTTHWWFNELPQKVHDAFNKVQYSKPMMDAMHDIFPEHSHIVEPVNGMNEVYVACPQVKVANSDAVFYMRHIDGPFHVFPFCHVYRSIVAVNENNLIKTSYEFAPLERTLSNGDAALFDFNREIHHIENNPNSTNPSHRVTLKVHYAAYPRCLKPLGKLLAKLTTNYDVQARRLFRFTLAPKSFVQRVGAKLVLVGTELTRLAEFYIGWSNVLYLMSIALLSYSTTGGMRTYLYASSLTHYMMYIATYNHITRIDKQVSFGTFKRDVVFFKATSMLQLAVVSALPFLKPEQYTQPSSSTTVASMVLIAAGETVAYLAYKAIGADRTYFGAELGVVEPRYSKRFPYNVLPHPMIVGALCALAGFFMLSRHVEQYLAPAHAACYLVHLAQELFTGYPSNATGEHSKAEQMSKAEKSHVQ